MSYFKIEGKQLFSVMNFKAIYDTKVIEYDGPKRIAILSGYGLPGDLVMSCDPQGNGIKALNLTRNVLKEGDTVVVALHEEESKGTGGRQVAALGVVGVIGWPDE